MAFSSLFRSITCKNLNLKVDSGIPSIVSLTLLEIEQLLGGNRDIDVADLKANTEYGEGYTDSHQVIKLFWEVMGSLNQEELARFLQFITGTFKPDRLLVKPK